MWPPDAFAHGPRNRLLLALVIAWPCCLTMTASGDSRATPPRPAVVDRFFARDEPEVKTVKVRRRLEARNDRFKKHGWIEAVTTVDPVSGFAFMITGQGGSGYVRDKVLMKALEKEAEAWRTGEGARSVLNDANYVFDAAAAVEGLIRVSIEPRRKDGMLVRGSVFFRPEDADLVRIEGNLAKNPSFWTREVHVVRRYARIDGLRVPVSMESTAQIVMAGKSTFAMTYDYEELNGKPVQSQQQR